MTALALAPDTRISYEPAAAAGTDRAIRVSMAIAVLAVAGVAAYVSYWHAYAVGMLARYRRRMPRHGAVEGPPIRKDGPCLIGETGYGDVTWCSSCVLL